MSHTQATKSYSPLYFLASVGAGGLSVTFFMYLFFWVPHPGQPVPVFEDIVSAWSKGIAAQQFAIIAAMAGIAFFAFLNLKALVWNFGALRQFKKTKTYAALMTSNAQSTLLAAPLAVAMSINGLFIVGLVFVPNLWSVVEFLFPLAMVAFALNTLWAMKLIGDFLGRIMRDPHGFKADANNSFAQALPAFALAMNAVGLSAPAAMSTLPSVVGTSLVLSTVIGTIAMIYAIVAILAAIPAKLHHGVDRDAAPTLMIVVPLVTILSIMFMRQSHGMHTTFNTHTNAIDTMMFLAKGLSIQIAFLGLGWVVLKSQGYFRDYVFGDKKHVGSYALVCPGVAFSVLMHFFINKGLVASGIIEKFGTPYWALTAVALVSQMAMNALVLRLNKQHFSAKAATLVPAE